MNKPYVHIGLMISLGVILALGVISIAQLQKTNAQVVLQGYPSTGRVVGTVGGAVSKTINMHGFDELVLLLQAAGGNFGSKYLAIYASVDNTNFILVDNVSLSTNTVSIKQYGETHLGTGTAIDPAVFPYVKVVQSAGNTGVTPTLTYSAH